MTAGMKQVRDEEKDEEIKQRTYGKENSQMEHEEEERSAGDTGCVEEEETEEKQRGGGRLVHTAPLCRPCIHTYSRTVQAADINNSLLIFIFSGEM